MPVASRRWNFASLLVFSLASACVQSSNGINWEVAIFPGEGRLGSTAAIAIDSNYIPLSTTLENYDVEPKRVRVFVFDGSVELEATVRGVFPLESAQSSLEARTKPGEWATFVLFDLPATGLASVNNAIVTARYDGVELARGTFRIVGPGGSPWVPPVPGFLSLERSLETRSLVRLRAVRRYAFPGEPPPPADAFLDSWEIGAVDLEIQYPLCLKPPNAYGNSEAANATAVVGPGGPGLQFMETARIVLVDPKGFSLKNPIDIFDLAAKISGTGPFLDIAFDRDPSSPLYCTHLNTGLFEIRKLYVTDKNGQTLIDRRTGNTNSSDLLTMYVLDREAL